MKRYIPQLLKYPLITAYLLARLILRGAPAKELRLNLLGILPPKDSGKIVHGGKVKLLALRERFGETWSHFNIAYFASSGLPFAPAIWLKLYKLFGVKIVWNQNGVAYPSLYEKEVLDRVNGLLKPIHLADYVIFQTEFTKRCSDKFLGTYTGPSMVLINPVDTKIFTPRSEVLPVEPLKITMSGHHFESRERLQVSLDAIKKLRTDGLDVRLTIIGNTQVVPDEDWIEVVGKFTREEAPRLYQKAHILLHLKSLDPCPNIVLEALACGLPVVGLDNGGMPELVDKASGVLIPTEENFEHFSYPDRELVANAIVQARDNLESLSKGAREQALKFDRELWLKKHQEIFDKILK